MKRRVWPLIVLVVATAQVSAHAADLVEVPRGDLLVAEEAGERFALKLAGIWVPSPAGPAMEPQYRGDEARKYVIDALRDKSSLVTDFRSAGRDQPVFVRLRIGGEAGADLAVLLAEAGYGFCDRAGATDRDQAEAICSAERRARRERRGIHDGGFQRFEATKRWHVNLGTIEVNPLLLKSQIAYGAYSTAVPYAAAARPPRTNTIHATPVDAIRDWGRSMGLPPDSSRAGH